MIKLKEHIRLEIICNMLPIFVLIIYYYTPMVQSVFSVILPLSFLVIWLVHTLCLSGLKGIFRNKVSICWGIYFLYAVLMSIIGISSTNLNFQIVNSAKYLIPIIGCFVIFNYNIKELRLLLVFFFIIMIGNICQNLFLSQLMPELFEEELEHSEELSALKASLNVGGTALVAVCLFMVGTLFVIAKNLEYKFLRVMTIITICIFLYYFLCVNIRGTTTILFFILILGFIVATKEPKKKRVRYYLNSLFIIVIISLIILVPLLVWITSIIDNESLIKRFGDIVSLFEARGNIDEINNGSFLGRIELSMVSLSSWLSTPLSFIFGIGDHTQDFGGDLIASGIGSHSEFFDCLGRYGIIGGVIFFNIIKLHYKNITNFTSNRNIVKYFNVVFFIIILYGFLNNLFEPITLLFIFIVFPIIMKLLSFYKA